MSRAYVYRHGRAARASNAGLGVFIAVLLGMIVFASAARAGDIETAKQHLDRAKEDLNDQNYNALQDSLKSAEEFLDGVSDAERKPVEAELQAFKKQVEPKIKAFKAEQLTKTINRDVDSAARDAQDSPDSVLTTLKSVTERLESEDAKKYLDPQVVTKTKSRVAGLQQMAFKGVKKRVMENVQPLMADLEQQVASEPFKGKNQREVYNIAQSIDYLSKRIRGIVEPLPVTDPDVKKITDRLAVLDKKLEEMGGASEKSEVIDNVARGWESTKEYFAGWDAEQGGLAWERYTKEASQDTSTLLMPKTIEAIDRTKDWLEQDQVKEARAKYADDAKLKAIVDEATKIHGTALAKLNAAYTKLLDEAEKLPTPGKNDLAFEKPRYMGDEAKRWFGGTKYEQANADRAAKLYEKWTNAVAADEKARQELFAKMVKDAAAAWPGIEKNIKAEEGFNPAEADKWKGRTVKIKGVYNRSGWDWTGYPFAITINGIPVAGRYAANIKAALDDVYEKTLMSPDDHEKWDVIAVVQGPGKISERTSTEIRDGSTTVGRLEGSRSVDCVVVEVVGLYAGPVAIGPGMTVASNSAGEAGAAGSAATAGSGGSGVLGWTWRILSSVLLLGAARVAFVKARPATLATAGAMPAPAGGALAIPAGPAAALLTGETPGYLGVAFIAVGVLQLLSGLVLGDLLPAAALIGAGVYLAADLLRSRSLLKQPLYDQVRTLGVPLAIAAGVIAVLHLVLGAHWLF